MRAFIVIVLAFVVLLGVLVVTPWGHDFIAVRTTRYAPGFSEQAFRSLRVGDTREQIITALGQPLSRYYIIAPSQGIPETVSALPAELPADASVREILDFSTGTRPRGDFRLVEVILDRSNRVESTRDYVTD
jgi:hypothetical protein